jgi:hypothetical protein
MAQGRPRRRGGQAQPAQARAPWQERARKWQRGPPDARKKRKKRKGLLREVFEEAFDVLEDIFD